METKCVHILGRMRLPQLVPRIRDNPLGKREILGSDSTIAALIESLY